MNPNGSEASPVVSLALSLADAETTSAVWWLDSMIQTNSITRTTTRVPASAESALGVAAVLLHQKSGGGYNPL